MSQKPSLFDLHGSVWMTAGGKSFGGKGRIDLLAHIAECGSITNAAKAMGMSYKAAWDAIDTMNNLAREPLVERTTGGKGGGGTRLTTRGQQLVANFHLIEKEHSRFIEQLGRQVDGIAVDFMMLRRISMKTSARNQVNGVVRKVKRGAVNDEIELEIAGGNHLIAIITHESTDDLALQPGAEAFALVKASSIMVMVGHKEPALSARNRLKGTIARLQEGAVNTEVVIAFPGGGTLAAIITNESCQTMALQIDMPVTALFKASSIILGVPA